VLAGGLAAGAVGLLAGCGSSGGESRAATTSTRPQDPVIVDLATLRSKGAVPFTSSRGAAIAVDLGDRVLAWSSTCTHAGCTVGWNAGARLLQCPCHGSRYDPTSGSVVRGPAQKALFPVPVTVDTATGVLKRA
jgi:Rieske Fe-S protein